MLRNITSLSYGDRQKTHFLTRFSSCQWFERSSLRFLWIISHPAINRAAVLPPLSALETDAHEGLEDRSSFPRRKQQLRTWLDHEKLISHSVVLHTPGFFCLEMRTYKCLNGDNSFMCIFGVNPLVYRVNIFIYLYLASVLYIASLIFSSYSWMQPKSSFYFTGTGACDLFHRDASKEPSVLKR